ncbi:MAG TPA: ribbon-helix-helix protein, CopG family, partial [Croceibacterium sp.]|nr:ribbon-helix-helix protein, CopG family [Croceibacterium sp.]
MTRILADLSDDDIKWLDARAAEQGKSRASVLREAVRAFRAAAPVDWLEAGFGLWA